MSMSPKDHPLKLTPGQEAHINTLSPDSISAYIHGLEVDAGLRVRDAWNPEIIHLAEQPAETPAPAATPVSVSVGGMTFSGSQQEVDAQMLAYFRAASARGELTTTNDTTPRDEKGRFAREPQHPNTDEGTRAADKALLELKYKRGEIDTASYIQQSGALDDYLQQVGVDVQGFKQNQREVQNWASATQEFLAGPLGADWPGGGPEVIEAIGQKISELGLENSPSAASLRKAWDSLQADADAFAAVQNATSREELDEALGIRQRMEDRLRAGQRY
jgi:hypothetical protein